MASPYPVTGAGLGLRRALLGPLSSVTTDDIQFMEVAPENWINVGGRYGKAFREYTERFPFVIHGLSLSIGSPAPLDWNLLWPNKGLYGYAFYPQLHRTSQLLQ